MPRKSPFSIVLSKEERNMLETQVRQYTSPYCDAIRAKIVLLAAQGLSNDVIAVRLDTPRQVAQAIRPRAASRPGGSTSGRPTCPLFAPASSSRLTLSPVNSPIACTYRCRDFPFPRFSAK